ncbi:MAG: hypothetical protein JWP91_761 [Fibrobacteres bacterium]|nr:hypothetical protein [Fibrobacterota bacterium]
MALLNPASRADSIKPLMFGPFFMNQINVAASPAGYDYVLTNGFYHFQVGWIEPLAESSKGFFGETYFETNGNLNISPFTSDIGTTFNLKPFRYLEFGLSYNRLMFHNSMVSFSDSLRPSPHRYSPGGLFSEEPDLGGADIFTYQGNLTFDVGRTQFYFFASRALWDIDAKGKYYVYEYRDGMLIKPRDRVNTFLAQLNLDLRPWSHFPHMTYMGYALKNQYWHTTQTEINRNLVSFGITGLRIGTNPERQRRGLDLSVGYWTLHDQIPKGDVAKSFLLEADWKWNIHFLSM